MWIIYESQHISRHFFYMQIYYIELSIIFYFTWFVYIQTWETFSVHVLMCVCSVAQSCLILCHTMDYRLPGSSIHRIFYNVLKSMSGSEDKKRYDSLHSIYPQNKGPARVLWLNFFFKKYTFLLNLFQTLFVLFLYHFLIFTFAKHVTNHLTRPNSHMKYLRINYTV